MHCCQVPAAGVGTPARPTPVNAAGDGSPQFVARLPRTAESPPNPVSPTLRRVVRSSTRFSGDRPLPTAGTVDTDETGPTTSRPRQHRPSTVIHLPARCEHHHLTADWTTPDPRGPGGDTPSRGQETPTRCRDPVTQTSSHQHWVTVVATRPRPTRDSTARVLSTALFPTTGAVHVHGNDPPRLPTDCPPAP